MSALSRRAFVSGLAALPLAKWLHERTAAQQVVVRPDVYSDAGQAMLVKYARVVAAMTKRAARDPLSWTFQSYIHWVGTHTCKADAIEKIYGIGAPEAQLAQAVWNTCQPHNRTHANLCTSEPPLKVNLRWFLPWHRMYLYYFERIARKIWREIAAPNEDLSFAMPYWDPSTPDMTRHGSVPDAFRRPDDPVFGSLYREERHHSSDEDPHRPNVNDGESIDRCEPCPLNLLVLWEPTYGRSCNGRVTGFNRSLLNGFHNSVHRLVGNAWNMGSTEGAANDPIFWVHHSNIDRIWASWNHNGGSNPTDVEWLDDDQPFTFVDEDGQRVKRTARAFSDITTLGYKYDRLEPRPDPMPGCAKPNTCEDTSTTSQVHAQTQGQVMLGSATAWARLVPSSAAATTLSDRAALLAKERRRMYLLLSGVSTNREPDTSFRIVLRSSNDAKARRTVEALSVFGANTEHSSDHGNEPEAFLSVDVTDAVRAVGKSRDLEVGFEPIYRVAPGATPVVARVALVEE